MASPYGSPPWSDAEKNFVLAELIKQAGPPPLQLLQFLGNINPPQIRWGEIALPYGRSLDETMKAFETMRRSSGPQFLNILPAGLAPQTPSPLSAPVTLKRPNPFESFSGREIRPKPSATGGVYGQPSLIDQPPKKKRGRPTKAEAAARAEAHGMGGESSSAVRAPPPAPPPPPYASATTMRAPSVPSVSAASDPPEPSSAEPSPGEETRPIIPAPPVSRMPISSILTPTAPNSASQSSSSSGKRRRGRSTRSEPGYDPITASGSGTTQEYESPYARMGTQAQQDSPARTAVLRHREDAPPPPPPSFPAPRSPRPQLPPSTTLPSPSSPRPTTMTMTSAPE